MEMAETEASLRSFASQTFRIICPFCFAKDGQCGFDSRLYDFRLYKEKTSDKTEVFLVEMAVIETASENTFPQISTSVAVLF